MEEWLESHTRIHPVLPLVAHRGETFWILGMFYCTSQCIDVVDKSFTQDSYLLMLYSLCYIAYAIIDVTIEAQKNVTTRWYAQCWGPGKGILHQKQMYFLLSFLQSSQGSDRFHLFQAIFFPRLYKVLQQLALYPQVKPSSCCVSFSSFLKQGSWIQWSPQFLLIVIFYYITRQWEMENFLPYQ